MKKILEAIALVIFAGLLSLATFNVVLANQVMADGVTDSYLAGLRSKNGGRLAEEEKMLYTTAQKVPFTFVGFTNDISLNYVLQALNELGTKGTFFVNERELQRYPDNIAKIAANGHELGIAVYPKAGENFNAVCRDILRVRNSLRSSYGQDTTLVRQFSGPVQDVTREAVAALGMRLIGTTVNVVQSRHKDYQSAAQILPEIFGKSVFSVGRGWIINIRTDFYTNPKLAADVLLYLKREKIDNIAYNEFNDISGVNPANDSAYKVTSISNVLADTSRSYTFPVPKKRILPQLKRYPLLTNNSKEELFKELSKRYLGQWTINGDDRTLGFSEEDMQKLDQTGVIKTDRPVVFFTFDDWGTDVSINHLMYVLRKHKVKGTFFILTHNIINGFTSTEDYDAKKMQDLVEKIRDGLYYRDKVRKGAIFVMHMSDQAKYTATALDIVLTANERKAYDDPTRFEVGQLSDYLTEDYSQESAVKEQTKRARKIRWW